MILADYFTLNDSLFPDKGLEFYVFDNTKADNFVNECLEPFRDAYIEDSKIKMNILRYNTTRKEEICQQLPDSGDVMSGDFGEILSYYLAIQIWSPNVNVTPIKWRFKDDKRKASPLTDIILFELADPKNPSVKDKMVTYEVKTRATKLGNMPYSIHKRPSFVTYKDGKLECTILEAVFDANKDAIERAAETIPYLKVRCKDLGLNELYNQIDRFSDPLTISYKKEHNAVAVFDTSTTPDQISRMPTDLLTAHPNVSHVYCVPMDNLREIYNKVYAEMPLKA